MINGYHRVTEVLSKYNDYSLVPPLFLNYAADRGKRVHQYCQLYASHMLFGKVDFDCAPYVQAFVDWFENTIESIVLVERRFNSDTLFITGQIDIIARIKGDDCLSIIDIKTGVSSSKTWNLQTAAYQYLAEENGYKIGRRLVLQLDHDGTYKVHEFLEYKKEIVIYKAILSAYLFFLDK
jgi:PD-(D/E)XK nuclease superfamily protein